MQAHNEFDPGIPSHGLPHRDAIGGYGDDAPGAEEAGPLVRPYVIAQGRDHADAIQLDMISVVIAAKRAEVDEMALEPEQLRILELCRRPQSVAEVSAHLDIPVAVVKVLLSDLLNRGLALARAPYTAKSPVSRDVLQAVLDGIQRL
ncbi:DUF742 domain-containing protein [Nocardiopsis exhalans]|uniref:DUF742 domain-containing protein n=2 Tax=Nocardiopsis TaxID=2013 RepID=A0A840WGL4_9ACTN|nr:MULTISPECIES: DUF742 domain-containing protein [Nocardiopsis]MBB5495402.1 hypothetical protein [Nocardiopsis metallicus]QRN79033.1 MAG: DUF742 domain-containing protein [Nocardiopsis sp. BM-2018]USY21459.1 DUF742 domain-containing protein [Nocardiopsis exhalans]